MPQTSNNFIKGKMNKDLDERLIPKGEYREAQNVLLSESEDSDVGALETIKSNTRKEVHRSDPAYAIGGVSGDDNAEVIGHVTDIKNKRIIYFVTNFTGDIISNDNIRLIGRAQNAGPVGGTYDASSTDQCQIIMYDADSNLLHTLVKGPWLNLSKNHLITGVQIIDDLLFWTDDYNQPRKINIEKAKANGNHYLYEDQISVAKYAPYAPISLVNKNGYWAIDNSATNDVVIDKTLGTIKSDYMKDKFIRFSYRYKYEDGEYSTFAPFTQIVFEPLNAGQLKMEDDQRNSTTNEANVPISTQDVLKKTSVDIMENSINQAILRIPLPIANERGHTTDDFNGRYANPYNIKEIQVVLKESNSRAIKVVKDITVSETGVGSTLSAAGTTGEGIDVYSVKPSNIGSVNYFRQQYRFIYRSEKPFQVLPEDQTIRVFDQVPIKAKALDVVGNRVVYGNFVENYEFPKDKNGEKGINYKINVGPKGDTEFNANSGAKYYNKNKYKYSNIKQNRTYQVGIVFADKFGRQSPVVLSSNSDPITDTFTVPYDVTAKNITGPGNTYSWSSNQEAFGKALKISFEDDELFSSTQRGIYNGVYGIKYNPHGWYSYRVVVKQTEQEYYNVYGPHPANSWSNDGTTTTSSSYTPAAGGSSITEKQIITGRADSTAGGRSWFTLDGDNINKIPRNPSEQDFDREGISGSDTKLYPKVISIDGGGPSRLGSASQEFIDVISIGNAIEQGLFSGLERDAVKIHESELDKKPRIYNFVYNKDRNPLVAELPNLATEPVNIQFMNVGLTTNNEENTDTPFGYPTDPNIGIAEDPQYSSEGLTVFETKPFESLIDIYYETGTCGLVKDLSDQLVSNTSANAPSAFTISSTQIPESTPVGTQFAVVSATDNSTGSPVTIGNTGYNLTFSIQSAVDGFGSTITNKFSINSSTGAISLASAFRFTQTNKDLISMQIRVNDPDIGDFTNTVSLQVSNEAPVKNSQNQVGINAYAGAGFVTATFDVDNGSQLLNEDHIGLSAILLGTNGFPGANTPAFFELDLQGNTLKVKSTSAWTSQAAFNFFSLSNAQRTMTIRVTDVCTGNPDVTGCLANVPIANSKVDFSIIINEQTNITSGGDLEYDQYSLQSSCDYCEVSAQSTFYAEQNTGNNAPYVDSGGGSLVLFEGNKVYTSQEGGSNTVSQGRYYGDNPNAGGEQDQYFCYNISSSGVVLTKSEAYCDDRESP